ncbi:helix-turn-helix domain-containing protein [Romboutsia sp. 1001285H_161024_C4]|uniref:helix-turn-helix domain-containing protein n=1 Tax=Romboutsia sp. 1001285H_161024_C4 TaxID=2787109 RepID=UPI002ED03DF1
MSNLPDILTREQNDMITYIINGESITDIAKILNVNRKTIYNWLNKDYVKVELDKRRQELTRQGNAIILKDLATYIRNIQALANDPSDKRTALAANQYLINRIYGNPKDQIDVGQDNDDNKSEDVNILSIKLSKYRKK